MFSIEETITRIEDNGDGTFSYFDEEGDEVIVDFNSSFTFSDGSDTGTINSGDTFNFDGINGVQVLVTGADSLSFGLQSCLADQILKYVANAWTCSADDDTAESVTTLADNGDGTYTYTSENNTVTVITDTLGALTCNVDEVALWSGTAWICSDVNALESLTSINTSGSVISYLDEDGNTTNIDIANLETATSLTNTVAGNLIGRYTNEDNVVVDIDETITTTVVDNTAGTITYTSEDGTVSVADISALESITTLVDNGNGTYTYRSEDGTATTITDTLATLGCSTGQVVKWNGAAWACDVDIDTDTDTTIPNTDLLAGITCAVDQVIKYDGTDWVCGDDIDTDTTIADTDTDTLADLSCGDGQIVTFSAAASAWICGDTNDVPANCSVGQFIQFNGTDWVCVDDDLAPVLDNSTFVSEEFIWGGLVRDEDLHLDNDPVTISETRADAGWTAVGTNNGAAYVGSPDHVEIEFLANIKGQTGTHWPRPIVRVFRNGVEIAEGSELFMDDSATFSGNGTVVLSLVDVNPGTNPVYTFQSFVDENRTLTTGETDANASPVSLTAVEKTEIETTEEYTKAFGKVAGNGTNLRVNGAIITRTGTGQYSVALATPRTTGDYTVLLTLLEPSGTRDSVQVNVSAQTPTGFDVEVHEGDNGTAANVLVDRDWFFEVLDFN